LKKKNVAQHTEPGEGKVKKNFQKIPNDPKVLAVFGWGFNNQSKNPADENPWKKGCCVGTNQKVGGKKKRGKRQIEAAQNPKNKPVFD